MTAVIVLALRVALALTLYYFLWRVLQTLWLDLKKQGDNLASQKKPEIQITVVTNTDGEKSYNFSQAEVLIGRGAHCSVTLSDESLSGSHARLSFHHSQWWLEDLGSTNGTTLNGDPITTPTVVISGDEFQCGNSSFSLVLETSDQQNTISLKPESGDAQ